MDLRKVALTCAGLLAGMVSVQAESDWALRLGVSVRSFEDASVQVPSGSHANGAGGPYGVQQFTTFTTLADGDQVAAIYPGASDVDGDTWGVSLQALKPLAMADNYKLELVLGLQYSGLDEDSDQVSGSSFTHTIIGGVIQPAGPGDGPNAIAGYAQSVALDADLFTLDLGLKASTNTGSLDFYAIGGPSLVFGDLEGSYAATYSTIPGEAYTGVLGDSDDGFEVGFAVYVGAGIEFAVNDQFSVGAEYRYDFGGTLDNDVAELELEAQTLSLFFTYRFR